MDAKYLIYKIAMRSKLDRIRKYFRSENDPFAELRKLPRYTSGSFLFQGNEIQFPDAASFTAMYEEIFFKNVYTFSSEKTSPFIIDCGANIGVSVLYFKTLYPQSEIIAFEPDKNIFNYLKKNINSFKHENVTLINSGVWIEEKELEFHFEGADAGRIVNQKLESNHYVDKIKVEKLSKYIGKEVDFLKIDIEGAELEVLKEIEQKLHFVNNIFIEYHSFTSKTQELDVLLNLLSRNGFRYYIYSAAYIRTKPFLDKTDFLSMDCLLNICATR